MNILRKVFLWISYAIGTIRIGFSLTGVLMALTGIGWRPWLAMLIGIALLAAANIMADRTLPKCHNVEAT